MRSPADAAHDPGPQCYFEVHGTSGPHLLLLHGLISSREQWAPNLPALSRHFRPVVVELLGHGRSAAPKEARAYRPDAYIRALSEIREAVGADRWFVCGQSLGAALTLRYAIERPDDVIAQIFTNSNSALAHAEWAEAARPGMRTLARRLRHEGVAALSDLPIHPARSRRLPPDVKERLVADCELHSPEGIAHSAVETVLHSSVRDRVSDIAVPTLLIHGRREIRFGEHASYAEREIPGLEVVPLDAGHAVNLEAASAFESAAIDFLSRWV